jgi:hypothetical protein
MTFGNQLMRGIKQKTSLLVVVISLGLMASMPAIARADVTCADNTVIADAAAAAGGCGGQGYASGGTAQVATEGRGDQAATCVPSASGSNCNLDHFIIDFINVLSALVGIVVVTMIVIGGVQYSAAGDDASKITAAKKRIINAIIAFVCFIFMFAFLQYIVPGGVL